MQQSNTSSSSTLRLLWVVVLAGFAVTALCLFLAWHRENTADPGISASQVSLRQADGEIQYRLLDGDWRTIISIATLTGRDGADGKDGQNGTPGKAGANGVNGHNGQPGADGSRGPQGDQGTSGAQGTPGTDGSNGADGVNGTNGTDGTDGREILLQVDVNFIQWRYAGDPAWTNLIALSALKGDKGDKGDQGNTGPAGPSLWGGISGSLGDQTDLQAALDSKVGLTGTQTIAGTKTFSSALITPSGTSIGGVLYLTGTGFPNGVVSAPVGSKYIDTNATNGAQEWIKKTGTGNTGWVVSVGDTGGRMYMNGDLLNGYTQYLNQPGYRPNVRRVGDVVTWYGWLSSIQTGLASGDGAILSVPVGFRPASSQGTMGRVTSAGGSSAVNHSAIQIESGGNMVFTHPHQVVSGLGQGYFTFTYVTSDPWPTTLPGSAS